MIRKAKRHSIGQKSGPKKPKNSRTKFSPIVVDAWDGVEITRVHCLSAPSYPPSILCFEDNTEETLSFLSKLSGKFGGKGSSKKKSWIKLNNKGVPTIKGYTSFNKISDFGTAPALVLAAIYDRAVSDSIQVPPAIDFPNWSRMAYQTLYELGFFEIIGHSPAEIIREVYEEKVKSSYKVSKILSGRNADGLEQASDVILELLDYLSVDAGLSENLVPDINSAISEAMINVARHAYPQEFVSNSRHNLPKKWWMSAKADRNKNTLTIVVYDQGASIPGTLPKRAWYKETVEAVMKSIISDFDYAGSKNLIDHEFINFSMKRGKTQTNDVSRGLGLPQMQDLIDACPDGTLSILSRNGLYKYGKGVGVFKRRLDTALEGTLVEWELTLPMVVS